MNPEIVVVGSLNNDVVLRCITREAGRVPIRPSPPPGWEQQSPSSGASARTALARNNSPRLKPLVSIAIASCAVPNRPVWP